MLTMPKIAAASSPVLQAATDTGELRGQDETNVRYCIVGAGPAGLQLGHLLLNAGKGKEGKDDGDGEGRDYVVLERAAARSEA